MNDSTFFFTKNLFISSMCTSEAAFLSVSVDENKTVFHHQFEKLREWIRRICSLSHLSLFSRISAQNADAVNGNSESSTLDNENKQKKKNRWPILIGISILIVLVAVLAVVFIYSKDNNKAAELINYENNTITVPGTNISYKMIHVKGGTFQMDTKNGEEQPSYSVTLNDYYIGETEVTQDLWEAVMGTAIEQQQDSRNPKFHLQGKGPNYPMYYVSNDDCKKFIEKLNAKTGKTFRLPTEAEWEYAARGGNMSQGYKYAGSNTIDDVAWYGENAFDVGESSPNYGTHPVGTKSPNELGLYDMSGNVGEWCSNNSSPVAGTSGHVIRGGDWTDRAKYTGVTHSSCNLFYYRGKNVGFRLVCD